MPWPLDAGVLADLTAGLETVLVVEDKLPFVESQLREALYGRSHQPLIVGNTTPAARPLLPREWPGGCRRRRTHALVTLLADSPLPEPARQQLDARGLLRQLRRSSTIPPTPRRTPYFCSGCPHNVSTRAGRRSSSAPESAATRWSRSTAPGSHGQILGMPQMGGEGAQWIGLAPFLRRALTSSRTSATAPSTTRARWRSARRVPRGSTSPSGCSTTTRSR